ncbi:hypothetical protein [Psychrobacillus sp. NPDC093200]|uniref:hypothetical protein n=1 Tax=Psychrobacillus sp. NPDC093200 TaxID=3390656 RepID=UPI003CFC2152
MKLIQVMYMLLIWIIPILGTWYSYRKMGEEKKKGLINEIKHPLSVLGIIPIFIGLLFFITGSASASGIKELSNTGICLVLFGWFVTWVIRLVKGGNTLKSIAMILIGISGFIAYIYLY